jgi:hypothetical protein
MAFCFGLCYAWFLANTWSVGRFPFPSGVFFLSSLLPALSPLLFIIILKITLVGERKRGERHRYFLEIEIGGRASSRVNLDITLVGDVTQPRVKEGISQMKTLYTALTLFVIINIEVVFM